MAKHNSDIELLQDLRDLADELGKTPSSADMKKIGSHSDSTYSRRFGSWNDALKAAGLNTNQTKEDRKSQEWAKKGTLEKLYWEEELSTIDIAEEYLGSKSLYNTVCYMMEKHGIERRDQYHHLMRPLSMSHTENGYEYFSSDWGDTQNEVKVHQLLAISEGEDPHEVFADRYEVHHKKNIPWLNTPWNIELLTTSEHVKRHHERGDLN